MTATKAFCENCGDAFVDFIVKPATITFTNKAGQTYTFQGRDAFCVQCGEPVWVDDVEDYNVDAYSAEVCRVNSLMTADQIASIPAKYSIHVPELAAVLGVDATLLQRVCERKSLDRPISELLEKICNDPLFYADLLEAGKSRIPEDVYKRSRETVNTILENSCQYPCNAGVSVKTQALVNYLETRSSSAGKTSLQKQLYYVQGFTAVLTSACGIQEDCEAWTYGPVYGDVYRWDRCRPAAVANDTFPDKAAKAEKELMRYFADKERCIIDAVSDCCATISSGTLSRMTHQETPWIIARAGAGPLAEGQKNGLLIPKTSIQTYFESACSEYDVRMPEDIPKYLLRKAEECK